ncbi:exonuclease [Natrinema saccharevitans]|uniref:Exonuclease n=1 Tax=Natrinema saccharevitans TaxID=301967 RepID=A0A1S8AY17_9EURY|nr:exonuclease [Natrinema saccharevitans]OLZ41459.1 exonuclease [Natrinema saccharevitans]
MATEGRSAPSSSATTALESAGFVRLIARADGDAIAASALLARALADRDTPYQITVGRTIAERTTRVHAPTADGDATVVVGTVDATADDEPIRLSATDRPAVLEAVDLVRDLGATPDPVLALAGVVAAGGDPGAGESEWLVERALERGLVDRRPGVAVPTADPIDGLAHSTRLRAPWSGNPEATREALADVAADPDALEADDRRAIGSLVALDTVGADAASDAAAATIGRALRPYATPEAPVATLGGFADVLTALARTEPGTATALALGHDVRDRALEGWREHGRRAHAALAAASLERYDGLVVVGVDDAPVETIARLAVDYRSPEPTVLAINEGHGPSSNRTQSDDGDDEAAIATREDDSLGAALEGIARELADAGPETDADGGVAYDVGHRRGYLRYDPGLDDETVVTTVRDLL